MVLSDQKNMLRGSVRLSKRESLSSHRPLREQRLKTKLFLSKLRSTSKRERVAFLRSFGLQSRSHLFENPCR